MLWANQYVPGTVPGTGWGTPVIVHDAGYQSGIAPSTDPYIAIDSLGNGVAVWNTGIRMLAYRFVDGIGWDPTITTLLSAGSEPGLAMDYQGNAIAVWGYGGRMLSKIFVPPVGWGIQEVVDSQVGGNIISMNSTGTAVSLSFNPTLGQFRANFYNPGDGWGTASSLGEGGNAGQNYDITIDGNGNALAIRK